MQSVFKSSWKLFPCVERTARRIFQQVLLGTLYASAQGEPGALLRLTAHAQAGCAEDRHLLRSHIPAIATTNVNIRCAIVSCTLLPSLLLAFMLAANVYLPGVANGCPAGLIVWRGCTICSCNRSASNVERTVRDQHCASKRRPPPSCAMLVPTLHALACSRIRRKCCAGVLLMPHFIQLKSTEWQRHAASGEVVAPHVLLSGVPLLRAVAGRLTDSDETVRPSRDPRTG